MEKILRRLEKGLSTLSFLKSKRKDQRWMLFFVGDYGETISLGEFKRLAIIFISVMLIIIVTMSFLFLLYRSKIKENKKLKNALAASQKAASELQDEKDLLMIRLVLAEKKFNGGPGEIQEKTAEKPPETSPPKKDAIEIKPKAVPTKPAEVLAQTKPEIQPPTVTTDSPGGSVEAEEQPVVGVEDLSIRNEADNKTLKVQFILRKIDLNLEKVAGYAYVVLKHDDVDPEQWFSLPTVPLASGKPSPANKGQYFSISRFKLMKFEKNYPETLFSFNNAMIFVFSKQGEILVEAEFPIEIEEVASAAKE